MFWSSQKEREIKIPPTPSDTHSNIDRWVTGCCKLYDQGISCVFLNLNQIYIKLNSKLEFILNSNLNLTAFSNLSGEACLDSI